MSLWERISNLEQSDPKDVAKYSFQTGTDVALNYVVYRWAQFVVHFVIAVLSFLDVFRKLERSRSGGHYVEPPHGWVYSYNPHHGPWYYPKWFLYLSSWSMFANMMQSLMGAVVLTIAFKRRFDHSASSTTVYGLSTTVVRTYQIMYRVALNLAVLTFMVIWLLIEPPTYNNFSVYQDVAALIELGAGSFLMLVDLFVVRFTYTMITGLYSLGVLMPYFLLTLVHHTVKGMDRDDRRLYIYPALDWNKPTEAVQLVGISVFLLEVINIGVLWWLSQLGREWVQRDRGATEMATTHHHTHHQQEEEHDTTASDHHATASDHHGEPTRKLETSKKHDKHPKRTSADKKLEELDAQIKVMAEDLHRMKNQLEQSPQDVILAHDVAKLNESLNKKIRQRDSHYTQHAHHKQKHE